ncbi:ATP-grasp domain-containing protein [Nonlabens antarcticus]|uniref:ATP-grasp enzyme n=1 Tax=Nonlabens antarcticus TaxID=392714 RepID=UPI001891A93E|nr:ATP-grasp enzyme [Nonlabens antarcticus]
MGKLLRSVAVLLGLGICSIPAFFVVVVAQILSLFRSKSHITPSGRTVLLTGGKMTKCLQLARMFYANGDRVIVAETKAYKYCGTRFSNAVDKFIIIPDIEGNGAAFCQALVDIARSEKVDLFVPVSSPKSALFEAMAKHDFPYHTKVFQFDANIIKKLDDKHQFIKQAAAFGLSVPESYVIDSKETLLSHQFTEGKKYILKKIDYDPVYRLDLRTLPHSGWKERVTGLPISPEDPWVLQEFIEGREVCTHTTTQNGAINLYICCDSSPFQVNYRMLDLPNVKMWVTSFVSQLNATGQISFDFIIKNDGTVMPIECNPRTHSAITLFHDQLSAAAAYYTVEKQEEFLPDAAAGHTYWHYHEMHRILKSTSFKEFSYLWQRICSGKEAVFKGSDPWPFFLNNHISIPYQLVSNMRSGNTWTGIDFNIGKLITPGGD